MSNQIGVVHLIRQSNGLACFHDFIKSYNENEAGVKHDLILVFKGFDGQNSADDYNVILDKIQFISIYLNDNMTDLEVYFLIAKTTSYHSYIFLNSFSQILVKDWLKLMVDKLYDDVGLIGATGSWQRLYSPHPLGVKGFREKIHEILQFRNRIYFPSFPNCSIRTNAFLIRKSTMEKIKFPIIRCKFDAHKFESGYKSLTRQVKGFGLKTLVVGRNGMAYDCEQWRNSNTFRSGGQENLLIADNQTKAWTVADDKRRNIIELVTWGHNA